MAQKGENSKKHRHFTQKTTAAQSTQVQTQVQVQSTAVSQDTTVETSVEVVQTLTQAVVSSMAKLRHLFEDDNYTSKLIDMTDLKRSGNALRFDSLKRGVTSRADRLLDWVEKGAGDAIKKGYLRSLKFAIYEDKTRPHDRLEEWVLYYDYQTDENTGQRTVSQVSLAEEVHSQSITISQAKRALGRFIADMAHVCTECLPELPPVVRVTVELDMNNQAPVDYCPPGLVSYAAENSRFADTEDWECRTRSVAKMNAGYHEVKLKVNYLTPRHDDVLAIVPSGLPCTKEVLVAAVAAVDLATSSAAPPDSCEQASQEKAIEISRATHSGSTHLTLKARETGSDGDKLRLDSSSRQKTQATESSPGVTTMGPASHSSADMRVKDQLARMLPPPTKNTEIQPTQTRESDHSTEQNKEHKPMVYSREKLEELDRKHFPLLLHVGHPKIFMADQATEEEVVVDCECGHGGEEGSMICCAICDKFQHLHCLGYSSEKDGRIPAMHVCYPCLLHGESPQQLHTVRETSLCRRVIHWLQSKDYDNIRNLAKDLGWKESVCSKIVKCLRLRGVLASSGPSKSTIRLDTSSAGKATLDEAYFDPTKGISDHLEAPSQTEQTKAPAPKQHQALKGTHKRPHEEKHAVDGPRAKRHRDVFGPPSDIAAGDHSTPKTDRKRRGAPTQRLTSD